jgi:5'-nucleotidase
VYNINERELEPVGGVSRFATLARSFAEHNPMMVFSGDALSPSNSACPRP